MRMLLILRTKHEYRYIKDANSDRIIYETLVTYLYLELCCHGHVYETGLYIFLQKFPFLFMCYAIMFFDDWVFFVLLATAFTLCTQ